MQTKEIFSANITSMKYLLSEQAAPKQSFSTIFKVFVQSTGSESDVENLEAEATISKTSIKH